MRREEFGRTRGHRRALTPGDRRARVGDGRLEHLGHNVPVLLFLFLLAELHAQSLNLLSELAGAPWTVLEDIDPTEQRPLLVVRALQGLVALGRGGGVPTGGVSGTLLLELSHQPNDSTLLP